MRGYSYDDVSLVPRYSEVRSRKDCDPSIEFLDHKFELPLTPANMRASIDPYKAVWLSKNGYFYALDRFYTYGDIFEWVEGRQHLPCISISVGVGGKDKKLIQKLYNANLRIDFITIDIAHGHSILMKEMIEFIKSFYHVSVKITAGNVTTPDAVKDLQSWGADAIKIGVGQGHTCTTRLQTGFGIPMFSCIQDCAREAIVPLIADGGVRHVGDIVKALVAGADMVMAGSMFARCLDSPAETDDGWVYNGQYKTRPEIETGEIYKIWYGSSTHHNKGYLENNEGRKVREESNYMTYNQFLSYVKEHLQSAISYAGGNDLSIFNTTKYNIV